MTKEKARIYLLFVNRVSAGTAAYVVVMFLLGSRVVGTPLGWERVPLGVVAAAGLLGVLLCTIAARTIINWETKGD
jgi:hypothetical protein